MHTNFFQLSHSMRSRRNELREADKIGMQKFANLYLFRPSVSIYQITRLHYSLARHSTAYFYSVLTYSFQQIVACVGWIVAAAVNCSLLYGLHPTATKGQPLDVNTAAFYNAVSRTMWSLALAWVTVACVNGYGGLSR